MKKNKGMIVGFLAPAVIVFLIVFLYPIIRTVLMSFFDIESVTDSFDMWTFVGIENYTKLFKTPIFVLAMKNIFKIWLIGGIIVMLYLVCSVNGSRLIEVRTDSFNTTHPDQQFRYMTLPLLKGVFKTNITMWTVTTSAFFVWSQLFSSVTANKATIVPVQYMYTQIFGAGNAVTDRNAGYAAAIGIILCLCVVLIFTVCNALLKDDDLEF